eukprot:jgi/Astpho2/5865/Aster-x1327
MSKADQHDHEVADLVEQLSKLGPATDDVIDLTNDAEEEVIDKELEAAKCPCKGNVTSHDLATLQGTAWLNDEVINYYLQLIQDRNEKQQAADPAFKVSVQFLNTFFWPKLVQGGHAAVRRWTRKRHVLAADLVLIPINHCNLHWCLATIAPSAGTLSYFDSMGGKGSSGPAGHRVLATLEEWLVVEAKDKQTAVDGSSCGVFTCIYAERMAASSAALDDLNFTQKDIPKLRLGMAADICASKLQNFSLNGA